MGFGAGVMLPSPAFLGDVWFGPADRSKAVSIMVEANVTGWWIGSILIPLVITEPENFQPVALTLALPVTVVVALFATFWKRLPQSESAGAARQTTPRRRDIPSMLMALLAFTLLGGVGFAIPGVQDTLLSRSTKEGGYGIPEVYTSFTNACFMLSGVICGVLLGRLRLFLVHWGRLRLLRGRLLLLHCLPEVGGRRKLPKVAEMVKVHHLLFDVLLRNLGQVLLLFCSSHLYPRMTTFASF